MKEKNTDSRKREERPSSPSVNHSINNNGPVLWEYGPVFAGGGTVFTKEELDELKKAINIVDFVGRYVNLQKSGSSYRGLCPFHSDKDPSFYVNPQRGFYHCFGCGEKGDIISFYQKIENLSFSEAVKRLADFAGITVKLDSVESEYDRYTFSLAKIAKIYHRELTDGSNNNVIEYLEGRGVSRNTLSEFLLGYSPENRTFVSNVVSKLRLDENNVLNTGVFYRKGSSLTDRFAGRLIIPIENESGRVVGFGGRSMIAERGPKYINSPETKYFQKNRLLYNLSRAKGIIKELNYAVVVEGYFDVMALYEAGATNVVGLLGTALTERHLRVLGNYTRNLLFFLDSDSAGQSAALRSIDVAEKMDFTTAVAIARGAKDPGELFVIKGSEGIKDALSASMTGAAFRVDFFSRKLNLSLPQGRKHLIEYLRPYIKTFREDGKLPVVQSIMNSLSQKTGFSESELSELTKGGSVTFDSFERRGGVKLKLKDLLRVYIQYPSMRSRVSRQLELMEPASDLKELLKGMKRGLELEELLDWVDEKLGRELIELASDCIDTEMALKILERTEDYTNKRLVDEQIAEIDRKLTTLSDEEMKAALLIKRIELRRLLDRKKKGGD